MAGDTVARSFSKFIYIRVGGQILRIYPPLNKPKTLGARRSDEQKEMTKRTTWTYYFGLFCLMTSCYSFDKEVALKEFKELKPDCEIVKMVDYECDGTLGECWYVEFKYKKPDSGTTYDTTLQYWKIKDKWVTKREFNKLTKD